jgi:hypothetical protein
VGSETGSGLIAAERFRQIGQEGYSPEHDDHHVPDELVWAAICYATPPVRRRYYGPPLREWPWTMGDWKPSPDDRIRELVKAGALIAAEIDRLIRTEST